MASTISDNYFAILAKHMETGIAIRHCHMTESQKLRTIQCEEVFKAMQERPWINPREYLTNKWGRTQAELSNDMKIINFMLRYVNKGTREVDEFRVRATANAAMKEGMQSGNHELSLKGAALLTKVAQLDKPESLVNDGELLPGESPFTTDVEAVYKNKKRITKKELARIRKEYGVVPDQWMQQLEIEDAEIIED